MEEAGEMYRVNQYVLRIVLLIFLVTLIPALSLSKETETTEITLHEALELALKQNRSLQREALSLRSSELSVSTEEAEFDLKIIPSGLAGYTSEEEDAWNVGVTLSKQLESGITASVRPEVGNNEEGYDSGFSLALSVPLLRGLGSEYAMNSLLTSQYALLRAKNDYFIQQENIVLQTVDAVYTAIQSQQQRQYLEQQLRHLKNHLVLAKLKEQAGVITAMDLYRAELRIKAVQEELTGIVERIANSLDEVKQILALPLTGSIVLSAPVTYSPLTLDAVEMVEIALKNRIEIVQNELALKEAKRQVRYARNNLLPQLDMELGYNKFGEKVLFDLPDESWTVTISSDTDLFRTAEKNQFEESRLNYRSALLDSDQLKDQITREVRSEINSLLKQKKQIELRKTQITQATGKLRLSESKFRHGMANNYDLLEAQAELQQAQTDLLVENVAYIVGTYRLRSALGTLIDQENKEMEKTQ